MPCTKHLSSQLPKVDVGKIPDFVAYEWLRTVYKAMQTPESQAYLQRRREEERLRQEREGRD